MREGSGPASRIFLTAQWSALAMLNYEVDPSLLLQYVPTGTEVDFWKGKAFMSLVGFRFLNARVFGIPFPFHCNFDEINLRFYVRRSDGNEIRRGVVFIREIVPRWAIALIARGYYNERYVALPMSHHLQLSSADVAVEYGWKSRNGWNLIKLAGKGNPVFPEDGSQEQFITQHYWGYAQRQDHKCVEYRVEHSHWKVWTEAAGMFEGDGEGLYGKELAAIFKEMPSSAFLAEGSRVSVYRGVITQSPAR
jgi:uncharacterized protein YqjF (DUF2071 family)